MRIYLLWIIVIFFSFYSWKDWYKGLLFLVFLMAVVERPDMPKTVLGIPGFNPWNLLFLNVIGAAFFQIIRDKNSLRLPADVKFFVVYYLAFILIAFFREINDTAGITDFALYMGFQPLTKKDLIVDDVFNTIKYAIPGLLLFYGCDSPKKLKLAIIALMAMYFLIAIQIIKVMPIGYLTDGTALEQRAIRVIDRDIGYYRSDAAIFLGGAAWAMYACQYFFKSKLLRWGCSVASALTILAVALTGGRLGQALFLVIGAVLAWYRWRRLFVLAPIGVLVLVILIPSVHDRFTQGFEYDPDDPHFQATESAEEGKMNSITSGRSIIWPHVIEKIGDAPLFGYGRRAMQRIGLSEWLGVNYNEPFPHPHNAYLQLFLDNGIILSLPILLFHIVVLRKAMRLFRTRDDELALVTGALGVSSLLSFMIGGIGQQSFYPVASSVGMLVAAGLVLRVYSQKFIAGNVQGIENRSDEEWSGYSPDKSEGKIVSRRNFYEMK